MAKARTFGFVLIAMGIFLFSASVSGLVPLAIVNASLNPHVSCAVTLTSISQMFTGWNTTTGGPTVAGTTIAPVNQFYSTYPDQGKKALTSPYPNPPPCSGLTVGTGTAIAPNGPSASTFVEIDNLIVDTTAKISDNLSGGDCNTSFAPYNGGASMNGNYCDAYGNLEDFTNYSGGCESAVNPAVHRLCIRVHIDNNWKGAGFCGTGIINCDNATLDSANNHVTAIDIQGFLWFNNGAPANQGRAYSPWELHPLTAVRVHVQLPPPCQSSATFSWAPTSPTTGQTVTFSSSVNCFVPVSYTYFWGDGSSITISATGTATHAYTNPGTYTVILQVFNSTNGAITATNSIIILSPPPNPPTASFTYSGVQQVGSAIIFSGSGSGGAPPYTYSWNFGDSSQSRNQTAIHTYSTAATYTVILTVIDSLASSGQTNKAIIISSPPPPALVVSFSWTPSSPVINQQISFVSKVTGGVTPYTYTWAFGDGNTVTGANLATTAHTYTNSGSYTVSLSVIDSANTNSVSSDTVSISQCSGACPQPPPPPSQFDAIGYLTGHPLALSGIGFVFSGVALNRRGSSKRKKQFF